MELVKALLPAMVFLTFTHTLRMGRHVRITVLTDRLSNRLRETLYIIGNSLAALTFVLIAVYIWIGAAGAVQRREYEGIEWHIPTYPSELAVAIGCSMLFIQFTINIVLAFRRLRQS